MNLIVDAGNSFIKLAVFNKNEIIKSQTLNYKIAINQIKETLQDYPIEYSIIASTKQEQPQLLQLLEKKSKLHVLSHKSQFPFKNNYKTPSTLGLDRLALVTAAVNEFPQKNSLIIDAGTCVTYDFIDRTKVYHGGAISPGLHMRFKAMHTFTDKLPLLTIKELNKNLIGNTTETSMQVGALIGLVNEIDGFINDYLSDYEDLTVILTGGDHQILSTRLKNSIFATSNFLVKGLNFILEYNKNT
ncbi:type III pantothenate kinase [Psychroflexus sp. ALD_RP9]|uniref:type III pantothenate kinase n=1 Tax=Psychroflexus sp. ALD_RP9 TaxID=2777186 RepID=UPI001A8DB00B|nr:type III pantothenate kinase [Psychroflexus sp. ALD_RP9]QSS98112.1 type III pantothenate kinase [Psychroflexus sp. ALD_RP9]